MLKGRMVEVVSGKSNAHGLKGVVFWEGDVKSVFSHVGLKFVRRCGFKDESGNVYWDYVANVAVLPSAEEVAAEAAAAEAKAAFAAKVASVDWSKVVCGKESMEAYGGHWECSLALSAFGDLSDAEISKLIYAKYPAGSSWGALRWPRGASSIKVDRAAGLVSWVDGYGMCD